MPDNHRSTPWSVLRGNLPEAARTLLVVLAFGLSLFGWAVAIGYVVR